MSFGFVLESIEPDTDGSIQRSINATILDIETVKNGGIPDIDHLSLGLIWHWIIHLHSNKATVRIDTKTHSVELNMSDIKRLVGELNH